MLAKKLEDRASIADFIGLLSAKRRSLDNNDSEAGVEGETYLAKRRLTNYIDVPKPLTLYSE